MDANSHSRGDMNDDSRGASPEVEPKLQGPQQWGTGAGASPGRANLVDNQGNVRENMVECRRALVDDTKLDLALEE